ncbi:hypothetical protein HIJ39_12485 [Sulfobacillus sp. DSM 109850]|uniref:Uncharacterized protein n=1 Tax=Sulfobacillus harzensis TaxID=2729629 RepID=A0A7Y0L4Y4_9FIRM|nr:hypothetical protein [Sulfobacillus harzensis]
MHPRWTRCPQPITHREWAGVSYERERHARRRRLILRGHPAIGLCRGFLPTRMHRALRACYTKTCRCTALLL